MHEHKSRSHIEDEDIGTSMGDDALMDPKNRSVIAKSRLQPCDKNLNELKTLPLF